MLPGKSESENWAWWYFEASAPLDRHMKIRQPFTHFNIKNISNKK